MNAAEIIEKIMELEGQKARIAHKALAATDAAKQNLLDCFWAEADEEIEALQTQLAQLGEML